MNFEQWMAEVNRELSDRIGITSDDCRDRCWYDLFDSGAEPIEAIAEEFGGDVNDLEAMMVEELAG